MRREREMRRRCGPPLPWLTLISANQAGSRLQRFHSSLLAAGCGRGGLGGCVCLAVRGVIRGGNVRSASTTPQANNMLTKSASHVSTARPGPLTQTRSGSAGWIGRGRDGVKSGSDWPSLAVRMRGNADSSRGRRDVTYGMKVTDGQVFSCYHGWSWPAAFAVLPSSYEYFVCEIHPQSPSSSRWRKINFLKQKNKTKLQN